MRTSGVFGSIITSLALLLALTGAAPARAATCGNNVVEPPEVCDDGNLVDGDGCDSNCTPTVCGNGIVTAGEECDDGNTVSGDCCSATCLNENRPPDCSAAEASTGQLWPPNHRLVPVTVTGVTDPDGDPLVISVTGVTQDEPLDATGDGATCPDANGVGTSTATVRAERRGNGDGRVYHVAFKAVDRCGATCNGEVLVCVRHDNRPNGTCGDGGPLYDSTAGAPPCEGNTCGPTDCVPDPEKIEACQDDHVPTSVQKHLDRAHQLLARVGSGGKRRRLGHSAAKQLDRAARRADRAANQGDLSADCATALGDALDGGGNCAVCSGE